MSDEENRKKWPIIYVRGYAMSRNEIDETTADPFCGFNVGSTVVRATADAKAPPRKLIFESPLVRLGSDFQYRDVYENGFDIVDPDWEGKIDRKSVIIYRYYDSSSTIFGDGKTRSIGEFAKGLSDLILRVRDLVAANPDNAVQSKDFRCYLVAHSMGGLVCRAFLQNEKYGTAVARNCVDKFFTYATPHNGIEIAGVNVPGWLSLNDVNNFNQKNMSEYLDIEAQFKKTKRVDWLPEESFPSRQVFCMVATNRGDYDVAAGLSRTFAGNGSDGLVRVANASVWGVNKAGKVSEPCATAYAYRSHSGRYGIVNSEEAYQNLARFLFGDLRVDIWVDVTHVAVPQELEGADAAGKLEALYQFEALAAPRGKRWYLTRRTSEEDSVAVRKHSTLKNATDAKPESVYLSSIFLANKYRVNTNRRTLAYSLTLAVRVPDYEVEKRFWSDRHYEGENLYRNSIVVEMTPPEAEGETWKATYNWQDSNVGQSTKKVSPDQIAHNKDGSAEITFAFMTGDKTPPRSPGIAGRLRFVVSRWNAPHPV
jgi:hypothetical protein